MFSSKDQKQTTTSSTNSDIFVSVPIPSYLAKFKSTVLSLEQVSLIACYVSNITYGDRKGVMFDGGHYLCITFVGGRQEGKYSVFALPVDLNSGPEYYINDNGIKGNEPNKELRAIVIDYLNANKKLNLNIENFL